MMILIGFTMMVGYFGLIEAVIPFFDLNYPNLSPFAFVLVSTAYATGAMKLQTRVERFYIGRHVNKHPESTWRYANGGTDYND